MDRILDHLVQRFPLINRIQVHQNFYPVASVPRWTGVILAAMDTPSEKPLCFVLPKRGNIARACVIMLALEKLKQRSGEILHSLGSQKLKKGQVVCIRPSGEVFVYGGICSNDPEKFWLEELDLSRTAKSFRQRFPCRMALPLRAILRLEPTTARRPKGEMGKHLKNLIAPSKAYVDELLDISTMGNLSAVHNEVTLLDSQAGFLEFVSEVAFHGKDTVVPILPLKDRLPLGRIVQPTKQGMSWFDSFDPRSFSGEPMVSVTSSPDLMANFCIESAARSRLVVVNGLSRLKNLQAYDDIMQTQRFVLFADDHEVEMITALSNRGCTFWWLNENELLNESQTSEAKGLFSDITTASMNQRALSVSSDQIESAELESAYILLEKLRSKLDHEHHSVFGKLYSHAWRLLNHAAGIILAPTKEDLLNSESNFSRFEEELDQARIWMSFADMEMLSEFVTIIRTYWSESNKIGWGKRASLLKTLGEFAAAKTVLIVRDPKQASRISSWLRSQGVVGNVEVCQPNGIPDRAYFDVIICTSWIGSACMTDVASMWVTPRIRLIGYTFEGRWLNQWNSHFRRRPEATCLTAAEKDAIIHAGVSTVAAWPREAERNEPFQTVDASSNQDILTLEQKINAVRKGMPASQSIVEETVEAHYVSFAGNSYAYLTPTHKIPVATELISNSKKLRRGLPESRVLDLKIGDFVVFPESSERELLQDVADKMLGEEAKRLRQQAHVWKDALKDALWSSGLTPERFEREAKKMGRPRHIMTIRNWFGDNSQIGPGVTKDDLTMDLDLVALITEYKPLLDSLNIVSESVKKLRSAHLSAGIRVRDALLQTLPSLSIIIQENGTKVDMEDLGGAWIVQVEHVETSHEQRSYTEVNRLLWDISMNHSFSF